MVNEKIAAKVMGLIESSNVNLGRKNTTTYKKFRQDVLSIFNENFVEDANQHPSILCLKPAVPTGQKGGTFVMTQGQSEKNDVNRAEHGKEGK